jgi:large subunit ribosomal protein L30
MAKASAKETVTVRQVKSAIGAVEGIHATLRGLGLGRIGKVKTLENTAAVRGMISKVKHLVEVVK